MSEQPEETQLPNFSKNLASGESALIGAFLKLEEQKIALEKARIEAQRELAPQVLASTNESERSFYRHQRTLVIVGVLSAIAIFSFLLFLILYGHKDFADTLLKTLMGLLAGGSGGYYLGYRKGLRENQE